MDLTNAMQVGESDSALLTERVVSLMPPGWAGAIDRVARRKIMSRSAYLRQAVLDRLKADGCDITNLIPLGGE